MNKSIARFLLLGASLMLVTALVPQSMTQAQTPDKVVIWSPGDNGNVKDWNTDPILQQVEKATNTQIEMVKIGWDTFTDRVNAAIASGQPPDIIGVVDHGNKTLITQWATDGVIAPFEGDVANAAPNILAFYKANPPLNALKIGGKIIGVPNFWDSGPGAGNPIHIRKDLLDKYGMQVPDTLDQYFAYLAACKKDGLQGVTFSATTSIIAAFQPFAGAQGLPADGWVKTDKGWGYWAVQPGIKDALLLFRSMVANGLVDNKVWESNSDVSRAEYVSGKACSTIWNGGGHIGRIQNDMTIADKTFKEFVVPAPTAGKQFRGYTSPEASMYGLTFITQMKGNHPVAAARILNYLASDEGLKLTAIGIKGRDYTEDNGAITLLPARAQDGFASEAGDTGSHPLATTLVSWVPQSWQDFALLYGHNQEFKDWYAAMWKNMRKYEIPSKGTLSTSAKWSAFQVTSNELRDRAFLQIVRAASDADSTTLFTQFVSDWNSQGGADAAAEMSGVLDTLYK